MYPHRHAFAALVVLAALGAGLTGCDKDATQPEPEPPWIPAPSSPENLLRGIEAIYNDTEHSAMERILEYQNLLAAEGFIFHFQPADYPQVGRENWALADEIAAHRSIFEKQEAGDIYSLELDITNLEAEDLDPPQQGREGWKEVFATSVFVRLLTTPEDGFEVQGGQARFLMAPSEDGSRWYIGEWFDLARP